MNCIKPKYSASVLFMFLCLALLPNAFAGSKQAPIAKKGETIVLIAKARLCKKIDCPSNNEIMSIPSKSKLKVISSSKKKLPIWDVIWYKVKYKGNKGWVSEFNTNKAPKEPRYR